MNAWVASNILGTKSMQKTVAPFANQVSRLVLLSEGLENVKQDLPEDVCASANNVYKACQMLIKSCKRQVERGDMTKDIEYLRQVVPACEELESSAENFVHVCQELLTHAHDSAIWRQLVAAGRRLLDATMKILCVMDVAEVTGLVRLVRFLQDRLTLVTHVHTMIALVPAFKSYSESLYSLVSQVEKRLNDLSERKQRDDILICISLLKRSSSHLAAAMKISVRYPTNKHAQANRQYMCRELDAIMEDLVCYLEGRAAPSDVDRDDEGGQFMEHVNEILLALSAEHRLTTDRFELDTRVESVIRHSMAVAHLSQSDYREEIVQCCKKILRTRNEASNSLKDLRKYPEIAKLKPHFDSLNDSLTDMFHDLETQVKQALVQQIVDVFSVTTEPLEHMVQLALHTQEGDESVLKESMDAFTEHAEKVTQVAHFAAANSNHAKRNREIRLCCGQLDRLEAQLLPAIVGYRQSQRDKAAMQRLKFLKELYSQYFNSMLDALDQSMDTNMFIRISGERILSQSENLRQSAQLKDADDVQMAAKTLIGQARRLVEVSSRSVLNHTVSTHRNAVLVDGVHLRKAISVLRSNTAKLVQDVGSEKYRNRLLNDTEQLVVCVEQLMRQNADKTLSRTNVEIPETDDNVEIEDSKENYGLTSPLSKMDQSIRNLTLEGSKLQKSSQSAISKRNDVTGVSSNKAQSLVEKLIQKCLMLDLEGTERVCGDLQKMADTLAGNLKDLLEVCTDKQLERSLHTSLDSLANLVPSITSTARQIAGAQGDEVDRLHTLARQWTGQVRCVDEKLSSVMGEVEAVSRGLVDSVGARPEAEKIKQCRLLENWYRRLQVVVTSLCTETADVIAEHQMTSVKDVTAEIETMTRTLVAMATTADNQDLKEKVELLARQWSVTYVCCLLRIDKITAAATEPIIPVLEEKEKDEKMIKEDKTADNERKNRRDKVLKQIQKFTIKGTNMMKALLSSLPDADHFLEECQEVIGAMNRIVTSLSTRQACDVVSGRYYDVMMVHWQVKFGLLCALLEENVPKLSAPVTRLVQLAVAVHTSSGDANLSKELELLTKRLDDVMTKLMTSCDVNYDVRGTKISSTPGMMTEVKTTMSKDHPMVVELRSRAARIAQITGRLLKLVNRIAKTGDMCGLELRALRVEWACLLAAISVTAGNVNQVLAEELSQELTTLHASLHSEYLHSALDPETALRTDLLITCRTQEPACSSLKTNEGKEFSGGFQPVIGTPRMRPRLRPRLSPAPGQSYLSSSRERANQSLLSTSIRLDGESAAMSAAGRLDVEIGRWSEEENIMVQLARDLSKLSQRLVVRTASQSSSPGDLIDITRQITGKALRYHHFATVIASYAVDKKSSSDLAYYADHLPDIATKLSIISSVRLTHSEKTGSCDESAALLYKQCENLVRSALHTLTAAQTTASQGIQVPSDRKLSQMEDLVLSTRWVRKSS